MKFAKYGSILNEFLSNRKFDEEQIRMIME
jgi:hypothetical protein